MRGQNRVAWEVFRVCARTHLVEQGDKGACSAADCACASLNTRGEGKGLSTYRGGFWNCVLICVLVCVCACAWSRGKGRGGVWDGLRAGMD